MTVTMYLLRLNIRALFYLAFIIMYFSQFVNMMLYLVNVRIKIL